MSTDLGDLVTYDVHGITVQPADLRELSHADTLSLAAGLERAADGWAAEFGERVSPR